MNATFFGLAFLVALNPKLLAADLLLTTVAIVVGAYMAVSGLQQLGKP